MKPDEIRYALTKQVPCIKREALFETHYGSLRLEGKDAERIADVVRKILEKKLEVTHADQ